MNRPHEPKIETVRAVADSREALRERSRLAVGVLGDLIDDAARASVLRDAILDELGERPVGARPTQPAPAPAATGAGHFDDDEYGEPNRSDLVFVEVKHD